MWILTGGKTQQLDIHPREEGNPDLCLPTPNLVRLILPHDWPCENILQAQHRWDDQEP